MRIRLCLAMAFIAAIPTAAPAAAPSGSATTLDPYAALVRAGGWVEGAQEREYVELLIDGDQAALRTRRENSSKSQFLLLSNPGDALMVLADRRLEFLWVPLSAWTGPLLATMRERMIRRIRAAVDTASPDMPAGNTSESTVRPQVRALLQYARILDLTGHGDAAETMLRERLSRIRPELGAGWRGIEWLSVASAIAWSRVQREDRAGAIAEYQAMEHVLAGSPFAVNATVNRAAALANDGQYADALAAIDHAWATYIKDNRGDKVPGSERQFGWIRACALHGLGRVDEARAAMPALYVDREIIDEDFVVEPDNDLKLRIAICMRDGTEVARLIERDLRRVGRSPAFILLQPNYVPRGAYRGIIDAVRADPVLKAAAATRMRVLPPEMTAALNGWR